MKRRCGARIVTTPAHIAGGEAICTRKAGHKRKHREKYRGAAERLTEQDYMLTGELVHYRVTIEW